MTKTTAVEFQRKFGEYRYAAHHGPVEITREGRRELVLISAKQYDRLVAVAGQQLAAAAALNAA